MKPNAQFLNKPLSWWADIKTISEAAGYTQDTPKGGTKVDQIKIHTAEQVINAYEALDLEWDHLFTKSEDHYTPTKYGEEILSYIKYRSEILSVAKANLMTAEQAKIEFEKILASKSIPIPRPTMPRGKAAREAAEAAYNEQIEAALPTWECPLPMNKQSGDMRNSAYLTCIVNMLIELNIGEYPVNYNPGTLTAVTREARPLRTMSRRVDGAFPSVVNPTSIWEIKEYYYSTTFGSRIADGVYETLLDGMEIREMSEAEGFKINHYLIVDAYTTWWEQGKPYLCRMVDMLHMGFVDEVLFGREVITRLPILVKEWIAHHEEVAKQSKEVEPV